MPNIRTPMDLLGGLIDPRQQDEPLYEYKDRLERVAENMLQRDLTPDDDMASWMETREREFRARVGQPLRLFDGSEDRPLIRKAESKMLTYDGLEDRTSAFRWPDLEPRGERPRYGYATTEQGGVASPDSLSLSGQEALSAQPGYVLMDNRLFYVPGSVRAISFLLPEDTSQTVLVPWHIPEQHPHRIAVVDESTVRLVGADGHEHYINLRREQVGYEANGGAGRHTHDIRRAPVNGPVFAQTQPHSFTSKGHRTTADTPTIGGGPSITPEGAFEVMHLEAETVETETDQTGHKHTVRVSPHDYWSGNFLLPAQSHAHTVEDWKVQPTQKHRHVLERPTVPARRQLLPRLVNYEGSQQLPVSESPFVMNLSIHQGWIVAECPGGFNEQLMLGFETGGRVPVRTPVPTDKSRVYGLSLDLKADYIRHDVVQARPGYDIVLDVRVEDENTGGLSGQNVSGSWEDGVERSVAATTDEHGEARLRIPTPTGDDTSSYDIELATEDTIRQLTIDLEPVGEPGGYGTQYNP